MRLRPPGTFSLVLLLVLLARTTAAQDSHYDTNQYGAEMALRSGAATAGVRDTSSVWYNPGALGFVDNPSLSVNANAYRLGRVSLGDLLGTGRDLDTTPLTTIPLLVSGMIMDEEAVPGHRFAFGLINRYIDNLSAHDRLRTTADVLDRGIAETAGDEDYVGSFTVDTSLTEIWAAGAWGYRVHPKVAIGATIYGALRQQSQGFSVYGRAVNPNVNGVVATSDIAQSYDYLNIRLLGRIGVAVDLGDAKFGLTWTTPSFSVFGEGGQFFQVTINNVDTDSDNIGEAVVLEDRQEGLYAYFESTMSLRLGSQVTIEKIVTLSLDLDWHAANGRFRIINPKDTNLVLGGGSPGIFTARRFTPTYRYTTVFNVAFAAEFHIDRSVSLVIGFNTDNSYAPDDAGDSEDLILTEYNLYHVSAGVVIREFGDKDYNQGERIRDVNIGIVVSHGSGSTDQFADFRNANESNFLVGISPGNTVSVSYLSVGIILGYTQHF